MQIENIPLTKIDLSSPGWDEFIFTYPLAPGPVKESIAAIGLQQPVVVTPRRKKYRLLIGVRRVLACRELGWREIPAIVHPPQSHEQLLWLCLHEKAGSRPLNALEKARVLQRFAELWQGDIERLQNEICPVLGLPATAAAVETHLFLKELPEARQEEIAAGRLTPQHADLLRALAPEDRQAAVQYLFGSQKIPLRDAREIIADAAGLAARHGTRVVEVFERPAVREILGRDDWTPRQRLQELRTLLHRERFPRLGSLEQRFEALTKLLAGGKPLEIKPPRYFEGEELTISFRARAPEEVTAILQTLNEAERKRLWHKLFALLQAEGSQAEDDFFEGK
ncbi:MAG: ParB/RepB/Spo0J family partition protein [candidate division KSB1 bacterium]|nr:ParB/RepB/Spo0J family partition protein [candidate division KSB1 bacterium]MDZ7274417.1 ParB/RepB/Spo0J family partition protein [candidate division KSB1 bacterium]MDZ7284921.1 ParB/RepB/Spo0J family partition protein [candidate division KSB1 bacterium]MDZ7297658.1 ParB/RepB/Spo0J family partition protein [candidate division KSB1 bacterium]MDZ7308609.1 ParB/RepB/Spo0J family partition protein [candidate division KSB1 bacterium]